MMSASKCLSRLLCCTARKGGTHRYTGTHIIFPLSSPVCNAMFAQQRFCHEEEERGIQSNSLIFGVCLPTRPSHRHPSTLFLCTMQLLLGGKKKEDFSPFSFSSLASAIHDMPQREKNFSSCLLVLLHRRDEKGEEEARNVFPFRAFREQQHPPPPLPMP